MNFADLFAGLGGFHLALEELGHRCVFACEKKEILAGLYEENYGIKPARDIRSVDWNKVEKFDILCAGFPCQPYSKAGMQKGLDDERNLFDDIVEALKVHKPKYFILENVKHLAKHDNEQTWEYIYNVLENELGYSVDKKVYSPHHFNIPQHRERLFIVGSKIGLSHFEWVEPETYNSSVKDFIISTNEIRPLEPIKIKVLEVWQEFLDRFPKRATLPGFPIWAMEFGATYPYQDKTPFSSSNNLLGRKKGSFGIALKGMSREEKFENLPSYARRDDVTFPKWKQKYIRQNRDFYETYKKRLKPVIKKIKDLEVQSWQKFEWNCHNEERQLSNFIIQFRGSGVRVKRPDFFPSLVSVSTQIPIIGWENRYISPEEGAKLQSMEGIKLPENIGTCFGALGNAVNVHIVKLIAKNLIKHTTNINGKNGHHNGKHHGKKINQRNIQISSYG